MEAMMRGELVQLRERGHGKPQLGDWYLHAGKPVRCNNPQHVHDVEQLLEVIA